MVAGEQCRRIVQRDRHQLGGARRDGAQDQLLRGQNADPGAPAAVPTVARHQPDPQHQLAAWPSQRKSTFLCKYCCLISAKKTHKDALYDIISTHTEGPKACMPLFVLLYLTKY
jgi:hypothetical protein